MKAEATEVARRILESGGNAFDAAVGGQAALAVTDFSLNGMGSDAVILVYIAREKKVYSVNAEPRAPKLAMRKTTAAKFLRATACSPVACRESSTPGTHCSTVGAR